MAIDPSGVTGIYAASVTVFNDDLSIDDAATIEHFEWLLDNGCDGVLVFGTTGEANSISLFEKLDFLEKLGQTDLPRERLMIGTGSPALPDVIALTESALSIGVHETLLLPPYYFKNPTEDGLDDFVRLLIDAVDDERLKLLLYHFPQMAGVGWPDELVKILVEDYNGVLVGMKDSSGDWDHMAGLMMEILGFRMFTGTEVLLSKTLDLGGAGTISATVNLTAPKAQELFRAWQREDETAPLQAQLNAQHAAFGELPLIPAVKAVLAERRGKPQYRVMRPPFRPLDGEDEKNLLDSLDKVL